jgi:hypothetical protein
VSVRVRAERESERKREKWVKVRDVTAALRTLNKKTSTLKTDLEAD